MPILGAHEKIRAELLTWEGVTAEPHRFGGTEFRLGRRELGHIHGDSLADIPFPSRVRDQIVAEGRAESHHILPHSGWVSFYIREPVDVLRAIDLFRLSFELATAPRSNEQTHPN